MSKAQAARTFAYLRSGRNFGEALRRACRGREALTLGKAPANKGKLDGNAMKLLEEDLHAPPGCYPYERRERIYSVSCSRD